MAKFKIEFRKSVEKDLKKITKKDQLRVLRRIRALEDDPRPAGCKKLSGLERYRIRQGNFRILYEILDDRLLVYVVQVGNRRDVYE